MAEEGGARGKGRGGGKSKRGRGKGHSNDPDGAVYNEDYYKIAKDDGTEVMCRPVTDRRSRQPCFTKFQDGKCDEPDCPYSHAFNLITAQRPPEVAIEHKQNQLSNNANYADTDTASISSAANSSSSHSSGNARATAATSSATHTADPDSDGDPFSYAYDMGYQQASSCAITKTNVRTLTQVSPKNSLPSKNSVKPIQPTANFTNLIYLRNICFSMLIISLSLSNL